MLVLELAFMYSVIWVFFVSGQHIHDSTQEKEYKSDKHKVITLATLRHWMLIGSGSQEKLQILVLADNCPRLKDYLTYQLYLP